MSDFLDTQIARALGLARAQIRPRLPSLFEPSAPQGSWPAESALEESPSARPPPAPAARPLPTGAIDPDAAPATPQPPQDRHRPIHGAPLAQPVAPARRAEPATAVREARALLVERLPATAPPAPAPAPVAPAWPVSPPLPRGLPPAAPSRRGESPRRPEQAATTPPVPPRLSVAERSPRRPASPDTARVSQRTPPPPAPPQPPAIWSRLRSQARKVAARTLDPGAAAPAQPTIEVTIGRVEVRATPAQASAVRRAEPRGSSALGAYLQKKAGRRP